MEQQDKIILIGAGNVAHHLAGALLKAGENEIAVYAEDNTRDRLIPSGKQSEQYNSYGCFYTRTTGIWQTVWLGVTRRLIFPACSIIQTSLQAR